MTGFRSKAGRMPRLNGPQTLAALRRLNPHVRCCFLVSQHGPYSAEDLLQLDVVAGLPQAVRGHLRIRPGGPTPSQLGRDGVFSAFVLDGRESRGTFVANPAGS